MAKPIRVGTVLTVSMSTGEVTGHKEGAFTLLPPAPGKCPECAVEHAPDHPHNQQSLYYQMAVAWGAGWFDGEGSFILGIQTYAGARQFFLRVSAANTHRPTLERMKAIFGGKVKDFPGRRARLAANPRHSPQWVWQLHGHQHVLDFCRLVKPYLYEKRQEAEVIEAFCERRISQRRATPVEHDFALVAMFKLARQRRRQYIPHLYENLVARMKAHGMEIPDDLKG